MANDLALLLALGVSKTRFTSVLLTPRNTIAQPIGQGKCKAIILRANYWRTNGVNYFSDEQFDFHVPNAAYFYYGDAGQQTFEYLVQIPGVNKAGGVDSNYYTANPRNSELIICSDLNEVFLRMPTGGNGFTSGTTLEIQVLIYE